MTLHIKLAGLRGLNDFTHQACWIERVKTLHTMLAGLRGLNDFTHQACWIARVK